MREAAWEDDAEVDFEEENRAKFAAWRAVAVHADMEEESLRLERVFVSLEIERRWVKMTKCHKTEELRIVQIAPKCCCYYMEDRAVPRLSRNAFGADKK